MPSLNRCKEGMEHFWEEYKGLFPKINWKLFLGILVVGFGVHSFRITQMLNAQDDIHGLFKGYGSGTNAGRWGLDLLGWVVNNRWMIGSFNLSAFDGMLTLIFLSLSVCIILELFELQNSKIGMLFAVVFLAYPVCSATFLYMFSAAYYGLSCLLAVLAAYCMKTQKKLLCGVAVICIAFSLGLYQAYFPVTAILCLLILLDYFLRPDANIKTGFKTGVYYVLLMCMGIVLYYVILRYSLWHFGMTLMDSQGQSSMFQLELGEIPGLVISCYKFFFLLPQSVYHSINTLGVTRSCILILYFLCLFWGIWLICQQKNWKNRIMIVLLAGLSPIAINLIEIMCSKSHIHDLMIYSTVFVFFCPVLAYKRIHANGGMQRLLYKTSGCVLAVVLALVALGYSWHANWNYVALDYMNRQTESYLTILVGRIKSTKNYKDEYPVLFVGGWHFSDEQFENPYSAWPEFYFSGNPYSLVTGFAWTDALTAYTGFKYVVPDDEECEKIYATKQYQDMSYYPDDGSIAVINDVIVVKIAEQ